MDDISYKMYETMHWPDDTYADGLQFVKEFLGGDGTAVNSEIGDGSMVYDHNEHRAEKFMIAGGGPSGWVWFIFGDEGDIDLAFMEYSDGHLALLPIPFHLREPLLEALRRDVENGIKR